MRTFICLAFALSLGGCVKSTGPLAVVARKEPEVVTFDGALGNKFLRAQAPGEAVARLRIGTHELRGAANAPVNLALVIDTSGSMEGDAIADARKAAIALVDKLVPGDRLAVVTFDSRTEVIVPSTVLDPTKMAAIKGRLARMQARGTTDLANGLQAGYSEVGNHFNPKGVNRIVLISDGVPNDPSPVLPLADAAGRRGIAITSLGLGTDYDESLMGAIATRSGGRFHYIKDSSAVAQVFTDEVLRLKRVVGRNLYLTLQPGPGVAIRSIVGRAGAMPGAASVPLGDLSEGDSLDVIVQLSAPGRRPGAVVEMIDATLGFDDAVNDAGHCERRVFLAAHATASQADLDAGGNAEVLRASARVEAAQGVLQAIATARAGDAANARAQLDAAEKIARDAAQAFAADDLRKQADEMVALRDALPKFAEEQARLIAEQRRRDEEARRERAKHPQVVDRVMPAAAQPSASPPPAVYETHDRAMEQLQWHH